MILMPDEQQNDDFIDIDFIFGNLFSVFAESWPNSFIRWWLGHSRDFRAQLWWNQYFTCSY
uniref:Uncharacterized protein n=1 Tax=Anguilla anguilla TaxID=7936 RepID=A0A0E9XMJ2_ANGAN